MQAGSPRQLTRSERTVDKTRRGGLPAPFTGKTWVGPGTSKECSGCSEPIAPEEREYEVEISDALTLQLHAECHQAWITFDGAADHYPAAG